MFGRKKTPKLGQHLLTSRDIARAVVEAGRVVPGDTVLEVGPGKGMLTRELLDAGATVRALEKDPTMVAILYETFPEEIKSGRLSIIEGDARDFLKLESGSSNLEAPYKIIANIPYYITGELLRLFLTAKTQPKTIALLVQKEVAERIARSAKESILSLSVKAYGEPHYVRTVKAGSFNPPPKVDSAILAITNISRKRFNTVPERFFFDLLHAGFGQKRKQLRGNLKRALGVDEKTLEAVWKSAELPSAVRAEDVPLEGWCTLAHLLNGRE